MNDFNELWLYDLIRLFIHSTDDSNGVACADDSDGDGVPDTQDICPTNKEIQRTDFRRHIIVKLDPVGESQVDPEWLFSDQVNSANNNDNNYH